jgi:hypothetical protein
MNMMMMMMMMKSIMTIVPIRSLTVTFPGQFALPLPIAVKLDGSDCKLKEGE